MIEFLTQDADLIRITESVSSGTRLSNEDALILFERAPLALLGMLATAKREQINGKRAYYNRNIHIEPTNICLFRCKFCSYRRCSLDEPGAWYYSLEDIYNQAAVYQHKGITEVHIVGGVHPLHTLVDYIEIVKTVKRALPEVVVKAYTAVELNYIIRKAGLSLEEGLGLLKEAGMGAIPGGGAEIFDTEVRAQICGEKSSAEEWLATHRAAHKMGITTNATILYGHIETYRHRIDHLARLRALQDETGGFLAFIPLKYRSVNNLMSSLGEVSLPEDMRMLAISRLYLDNFDHIKAYWVMLGKDATELALAFGADDIDGTIDDTTKIYSMAGVADQKPSMTTSQMRSLIARMGYVPIERDTFYREIL